MKSDVERYAVARVGYKLIVEWGFSVNKASKALKMHKATLRKYMNTFIQNQDEIAALAVAIENNRQSNKAYSDIVIESMISIAASSSETTRTDI